MLSTGCSTYSQYQHGIGDVERGTGPIFMPTQSNLPHGRERSTSAPNVSYNVRMATEQVLSAAGPSTMQVPASCLFAQNRLNV